MIFGEKSAILLRYSKARRKLREYSVPVGDWPKFPRSPDAMSITSVHVLQEFIDDYLQGNGGENYISDLTSAASYFDSAASDEAHSTTADGYWTLAAVAYYMLRNYGSAKVMAEQVSNFRYLGDYGAATLAEISYVLGLQSVEAAMSGIERTTISDAVRQLSSFVEGRDDERPDGIFLSLRSADSPEDSIMSEALAVVSQIIADDATRTLMPEYSGSPLSSWVPYLTSANPTRLLWPSQVSIGERGVFKGDSAFVQLPTGSGKTKSLELIIRSLGLRKDDAHTVVIAPLRALCNEVFRDLSASLDGVARVNLASDTFEMDEFLQPAAVSGQEVIVCTPEKYAYIVHHQPTALGRVDQFIFDEAHLLDDRSRGPAFELLISEILEACPSTQIVLLSAVVSNPKEIAEWLFGDSERVVDEKDVPTSEKSLGIVSRGAKTISFRDVSSWSEQDYFIPHSCQTTKLKKMPRERKERLFPDIADKKNAARDLATYYANRLASNGASAIYLAKKRSIPPFFDRIGELSDRGFDFHGILEASNREELSRLSNLFLLHYGAECVYLKGIKSGIVPHDGGLPEGIRQCVEYALKRNLINVVACTPTLAQGVNLPIKYLFITSVRSGNFPPKARDFQNLIGRTARPGTHSEGSVILTDLSDEPGGSNKARDYRRLLNPSQKERCTSAILSIFDPVIVSAPGDGRIEGESIVKGIIDQVADINLEDDLANAIDESFVGYPSESLPGRIAAKRILHPIHAIESYLSAALSSVGTIEETDFAELCKRTFAYHLANDDQKVLLVKLFCAIGENLEDIQIPGLATLCGRSQLGISESRELLEWCQSPDVAKRLCDDGSRLGTLLGHFYSVVLDEQIKVELNAFSAMVDMWMGGSSIGEISARLSTRGMSLGDTEKMLLQTISYGLSHFIGCVADAVEIGELVYPPGVVESLRRLQRQIKYGVTAPTATVICERLFNDRLVANMLSDVLGIDVSTQEDLDLFIDIFHDRISSVLKPYPSYYATCVKRHMSTR
jgi:hypothetical protein